jgi:hypothetical protein
MIPAIYSLLLLSVLAMCWWAFIWPVVVSTDPANAVYHYGCILTLLVFFSCIVVSLAIRAYSTEPTKG